MIDANQLISWYRFSLTGTEISIGKELDVRIEFQTLYERLGCPEDISLFCQRDPSSEPMQFYVSTDDENLFHTKLIQYFIKKHQGIPCEEPQKDFVSPLVCNNPWELFHGQ